MCIYTYISAWKTESHFCQPTIGPSQLLPFSATPSTLHLAPTALSAGGGEFTLPLQAMPGRAPWVDVRSPGARLRPPAPGLPPGWGPISPIQGVTIQIYSSWGSIWATLSLVAHLRPICHGSTYRGRLPLMTSQRHTNPFTTTGLVSISWGENRISLTILKFLGKKRMLFGPACMGEE